MYPQYTVCRHLHCDLCRLTSDTHTMQHVPYTTLSCPTRESPACSEAQQTRMPHKPHDLQSQPHSAGRGTPRNSCQVSFGHTVSRCCTREIAPADLTVACSGVQQTHKPHTPPPHMHAHAKTDSHYCIRNLCHILTQIWHKFRCAVNMIQVNMNVEEMCETGQWIVY
eukprot:scpid98209/ scgid20217/ 